MSDETKDLDNAKKRKRDVLNDDVSTNDHDEKASKIAKHTDTSATPETRDAKEEKKPVEEKDTDHDDSDSDSDDSGVGSAEHDTDGKNDQDATQSVSVEEKIMLVETKRKELLDKLSQVPPHRKAKHDDDFKFAVFGENVPDHTSGPPKGYFKEKRKRRNTSQHPRRAKKADSDDDDNDDNDEDSDRGNRYLARHHSRSD